MNITVRRPLGNSYALPRTTCPRCYPRRAATMQRPTLLQREVCQLALRIHVRFVTRQGSRRSVGLPLLAYGPGTISRRTETARCSRWKWGATTANKPRNEAANADGHPGSMFTVGCNRAAASVHGAQGVRSKDRTTPDRTSTLKPRETASLMREFATDCATIGGGSCADCETWIQRER